MCESRTVSEDPVPQETSEAWLRLEGGGSHILLQPHECGSLRDELRSMRSPAAGRLASQLEVAVTILDAAPLHAGTRSVRVAADERASLLEAARVLERSPNDRFALLVESFATE